MESLTTFYVDLHVIRVAGKQAGLCQNRTSCLFEWELIERNSFVFQV